MPPENVMVGESYELRITLSPVQEALLDLNMKHKSTGGCFVAWFGSRCSSTSRLIDRGFIARTGMRQRRCTGLVGATGCRNGISSQRLLLERSQLERLGHGAKDEGDQGPQFG